MKIDGDTKLKWKRLNKRSALVSLVFAFLFVSAFRGGHSFLHDAVWFLIVSTIVFVFVSDGLYRITMLYEDRNLLFENNLKIIDNCIGVALCMLILLIAARYHSPEPKCHPDCKWCEERIEDFYQEAREYYNNRP